MKVYTAVVLIVLALHATAVTGRCSPDEIEMCSKDSSHSCFCRHCLTCPPGYGLNHQCGGQVWDGTVIRCVPCKKGVSYSEDSSISACEPCPQCDGKKTLQECTSTNKTVCSEDECEEGYIMNFAVNDCIKVLQAIKSTKKLMSTPFTSSPTRINTKQFLAPKPTSNITIISRDVTDKPNVAAANHHSIVIIILVSILLILVGLGLVYWVKRKSIKQCARDVAKAEEFLLQPPVSSSPRSSDESIKDEPYWPKDFRFNKIEKNLSRYIAIKISQPNDLNGWREIGEELEVDDIVLDAINIEGDGKENKGKKLFDVLGGINPKLLLNKFVLVLAKCGRNDLVEEIKNHFINTNTHFE